MKKIFYSLLLGTLILSCGDKSENPVKNTPPSAPIIISPLDLSCNQNPVAFTWQYSFDSFGSVKEYIVEIATDSNFKNVIVKQTNESNSAKITLPQGKNYFWRVFAVDNTGLLSNPSVFNKIIVPDNGIVNQLPSVPSLIYPLNNSVLTGTKKVVLKWNASKDADVSDNITYEVYTGGWNPENKKAEKLTTTSYELEVFPGYVFFWKIVARDSKGGASESDVYKFDVK